ncbi:MAG: class I SAM-dependent RNA methyltransferase [Alphaproteobacteria bacterium]|nr:class I SAM-dependent RNA methyltransferase [Alphaproteobacteria bacterium]
MSQGKVFDLGRQGDGLIKHEGQNIFVAGALPEESIRYRLTTNGRAELEEVLSVSADRTTPVCPFFEQCGGCALQHLSDGLYRKFKLRYFKELFPAEWNVSFDEPVFIPFKSRRRATFAVFWNGNSRKFGFNAKRSNKIVEIDSCAVLTEPLEKLIAPLRRFVCDKKRFYPKKKGVGDVSVLMTQTGADVLLTLPFAPDFDWRQSAADFAAENGLARISWRTSEQEEPEPLAVLHTPELKVGDFILKPPAGVFLQPSVEGQEALTQTVAEYVGKAKKVMDLFCGAGTFSLPLLQKKRIIKGADNAPFALQALKEASAGRIETQERDLFKTPLYPDELDGFDCVIFDPPRAGAKAQCEQIAASGVKKVVAVSCNPVSFARDAEILVNAGFKLERIRPVDQFAFTPHLECVVKLTRAGA